MQKASTSIAIVIVYKELERCDLVAKSKVCQKNTHQKCRKTLLDLCQGLDCLYVSLCDSLKVSFMRQQKQRFSPASSTHCQRYGELTNSSSTEVIYKRFLRKDKRIILTASHDLHMEKGPYSSPITQTIFYLTLQNPLHRDERTCISCTSKIKDKQSCSFSVPPIQHSKTEIQRCVR